MTGLNYFMCCYALLPKVSFDADNNNNTHCKSAKPIKYNQRKSNIKNWKSYWVWTATAMLVNLPINIQAALNILVEHKFGSVEADLCGMRVYVASVSTVKCRLYANESLNGKKQEAHNAQRTKRNNNSNDSLAYNPLMISLCLRFHLNIYFYDNFTINRQQTIRTQQNIYVYNSACFAWILNIVNIPKLALHRTNCFSIPFYTLYAMPLPLPLRLSSSRHARMNMYIYVYPNVRGCCAANIILSVECKD